MKALNGNSPVPIGLFAMIAGLFFYSNAFALVSDGSFAYPPGGWKQLCTGDSITVIPRTASSRDYRGNGTCWINTAQDKSDASKQSWVQVPVRVNGNFDLNSKKFVESLTFNTSSGAKKVGVNGTCADDPWLTSATCSASNPNQLLYANFGWASGGLGLPPGPMSRNVFGADLVQSLLNKQESKPPLAPVGLDSVRWPAGNGEVGEVKWRAGDMSDNKWVLQFDIEYANYADSTFTKAGQRVGPGPKKNMSAADANLTYVFMTPFKLQGSDYYFRVCANNDAGRQCSAPVLARKPTMQEQASTLGNKMRVGTGIMPLAGGNTPNTAGAGKPSGPVALGAGRSGSSTGGGSTPPASATTKEVTPRVFGAALIAKSGGTAGTGGAGSGGTTGGIGGTPGGGGATPGFSGPGSNKPDLAVASDGIQVNDRTMTSSATNRLALHADASNTCAVRVSFRYSNLGKVAAKNVIAELRDSLQPAQTIATSTVPTLTPGQSSTISGIKKISVTTTEEKVTYTAIVVEKGQLKDDSNVSNNRGAITLYVLCQANSGTGTITAAPIHAPTAVGGTGTITAAPIHAPTSTGENSNKMIMQKK